MKKVLLLWGFWSLVVDLRAQPDCYATITVDKPEVYVQQPVRLNITVMTSTWFTAPPEWQALQLPDAFILPFGRTTPGMFSHSGKPYAGLQFYLIVFPYKEGEYRIPPIDITVHTPVSGSSIGRLVHVQTGFSGFVVRSTPEGSGTDWFVAKNVSITERWNRSLEKLKVGDVLERSVAIRASGTLPQFIPPLKKETIGFAAVYLQSAVLTDLRDDYDANGLLTQRVIYLLEREGAYVLPDVKERWWNAAAGKFYTRVVAGSRIYVGANPHSGILASIKDSLAASVRPLKTIPKKGSRGFKNPLWYWIAAMALVAAFISYWAFRFIVVLKRGMKQRRMRWLASEGYAFRQFMRSPMFVQLQVRFLYKWFDKVRLPDESFAIGACLHDDQKNLRHEIERSLRMLYDLGEVDMQTNTVLKKEVRGWRKRIKREHLFQNSRRIVNIFL